MLIGWGTERMSPGAGPRHEARTYSLVGVLRLMRAPPHLIVKLKSLHVHAQELGIHFELSRLISRTDVEDHISEAIRNRIQGGGFCLFPGSQSHSLTHGSSPRAVPWHRSPALSSAIPGPTILPLSARPQSHVLSSGNLSQGPRLAMGCLEPRPLPSTFCVEMANPPPFQQLLQGKDHPSPPLLSGAQPGLHPQITGQDLLPAEETY